MAKGLWHQARAFLAAGLTPHRPLIHLTQQEALKLPFQCPSPACCGLCAFLYHPWQELCSTSWRGAALGKRSSCLGHFPAPGWKPLLSCSLVLSWGHPSSTLPGCLGARTALAKLYQSSTPFRWRRSEATEMVGRMLRSGEVWQAGVASGSVPSVPLETTLHFSRFSQTTQGILDL